MTRDLAGGLFAMVLGGIYLLYATRIHSTALDDTVGPAGFPKALAVIMIALGLLLVVQTLATGLRRAKPSPDGRGDADAEASGLQPRAVIRAGGMLLLGILYVAVVPYAGYLVTTAALAMAVALYQGVDFSWRVVAVSIGGAVALWIIFNLLLGVGLPAGRLGDLL